jgi:hypothetical protein
MLTDRSVSGWFAMALKELRLVLPSGLPRYRLRRAAAAIILLPSLTHGATTGPDWRSRPHPDRSAAQRRHRQTGGRQRARGERTALVNEREKKRVSVAHARTKA